jgi:hypothetical protein
LHLLRSKKAWITFAAIACPVILVGVVASLFKLNFGYTRVDAAEFLQYQVNSMQPLLLHKVPWSHDIFGELFVDGEAICIVISPDEYAKARGMAYPKDQLRLELIKAGWSAGWDAGLREKTGLAAGMVVPKGMPPDQADLWEKCWRHGAAHARAQ